MLKQSSKESIRRCHWGKLWGSKILLPALQIYAVKNTNYWNAAIALAGSVGSLHSQRMPIPQLC